MSEIELSINGKPNGVGGNFDNDTDSATLDGDSEGIGLLQNSLDNSDEELENGLPHTRFFSQQSQGSASGGKLCRIWHKHWLGPDHPNGWTMRWWPCDGRARATLLDAPALKLVKFFLVTATCLAAVHCYAHLVGDKRDVTYDLRKMIVYDGKPIVTDLVVFFVVGRLYEAPSVDTLSFGMPLLGTAILQSWGATHLTNLQHSITPYELKCEWTWQMYLLVFGGCLPLLGGLLVVHCKEVYRRGNGLRSMIEFLFTGIVFLLPYGLLSDGRFFHLHHWYYAWFLGMHCNLHGKWWSHLAMSILWGIYINGVAVFGRDPVLTCSLTLYQSQAQECPYLADNMGYGQYTLDDLARDSGFYNSNDGMEDGGGTTEAIICASDVTRWLSGVW